MKGKITKICATCKLDFLVFHCENHRKYCSIKCREVAMVGKRGYWVGRKRSKEDREKMSMAKLGYIPWNKGLEGFRVGEKRPGVMPMGERHWSWKGGVSRDSHSTKEPKYKEWRTEVFKRDEWKCRIADENCSGQLQAHHILRWADYPELRYKVNNGIALCLAHHPRKRAEEKRLSPYFQSLVSVSK